MIIKHKENDDYIIALTSPDSQKYAVSLKCTVDAQMSLVEQKRKSLVRHPVCVNSMTAHAFVCVWSQMLLGVLTTDKRRRSDTG